MGYVDYQFENVFERPVENFMWRVILLVLSGGCHQDWYFRARQLLEEQVEKNKEKGTDLFNLINLSTFVWK
ncbi:MULTISPECIES: hypothetical protein [Pseudomonas]|uniref:Uncharacterized protein n=1 Tax=Pseudomonas aphyarum TaxID=2942629 RepID=A0ABT5PKS0_9PSED|nr:hypothetical protein [Pseudomonas aphyarum]MDD0968588.1 hypothetical protein [Pseudomonas aphyarum]MDD1124488.1 hypothetical protein [Pseudomonas aphyarum]